MCAHFAFAWHPASWTIPRKPGVVVTETEDMLTSGWSYLTWGLHTDMHVVNMCRAHCSQTSFMDERAVKKITAQFPSNSWIWFLTISRHFVASPPFSSMTAQTYSKCSFQKWTDIKKEPVTLKMHCSQMTVFQTPAACLSLKERVSSRVKSLGQFK